MTTMMFRQFTITGTNKMMDSVLYGQLCNEAMLGMDMLLEDMKESLKQFRRKSYPSVFEQMKYRYAKVFDSIEAIYNDDTQNPEKWLDQLAERFVGSAGRLIEAPKWKFQKENRKIDCVLFTVSYVFPLILDYQGNMSQTFAKTLRDHWNEAFGTQLECGSYEQIYSGFRTGILGIPFGGK